MFSSTEERDLMASFLQSRGIATSKPYKDITEVASTYYGYEKDCPVSEQVARRVLVVPNNHNLKKGEIERVADCVNAGWAKIIARSSRNGA